MIFISRDEHQLSAVGWQATEFLGWFLGVIFFFSLQPEAERASEHRVAFWGLLSSRLACAFDIWNGDTSYERGKVKRC